MAAVSVMVSEASVLMKATPTKPVDECLLLLLLHQHVLAGRVERRRPLQRPDVALQQRQAMLHGVEA
jgi:hypothetical protein